MAATTVTVRIVDKEYQVACQAEEVDELVASARHLDKQMRAIRETGKVLGLDRMAVMAALNITHEFLRMQANQSTLSRDADQRIADLLGRVTKTLDDVRRPAAAIGQQ